MDALLRMQREARERYAAQEAAAAAQEAEAVQSVVEVTDAAAVQATVEEAEAESSTDAVAVEVGDRDGREAVGGVGPVGADSLALEASQVQECAEDTHMSGQRQAEVGDEEALMSSESQEVQRAEQR